VCDSLVVVVVKLVEASDIGNFTLSDSRRTYIVRSEYASPVRRYKGVGYLRFFVVSTEFVGRLIRPMAVVLYAFPVF